MSESESEWQAACPVNQLTDGQAVVPANCPTVALVNSGGEYFAIEDKCSHGRSSMSEGFVEGNTIECVLHGALFDLRTGDALTAPATVPLKTFPVRVEDGFIYIKSSQEGQS